MFAMTTVEALAQSRTFYDAGGKVVGRSLTDNSRTTTLYDASGQVILAGRCGSSPRTRRARRCAGSATRNGAKAAPGLHGVARDPLVLREGAFTKRTIGRRRAQLR